MGIPVRRRIFIVPERHDLTKHVIDLLARQVGDRRVPAQPPGAVARGAGIVQLSAGPRVNAGLAGLPGIVPGDAVDVGAVHAHSVPVHGGVLAHVARLMRGAEVAQLFDEIGVMLSGDVGDVVSLRHPRRPVAAGADRERIDVGGGVVVHARGDDEQTEQAEQ